MYEYRAQLIRVVDGDTWILDVSLGFNLWVRNERIRASGINCPELSTDAGKEALAWVRQWFATHCPDGVLTVTTQKDRADNYGRILGTVTALDGACLNTDLLANGYAAVWPAEKPGTPGSLH
jgi:micrococcal nuclease